ncbi:MAG: hypothetical protein JNL12_10830 [Planctomycetes bacterium]|nr:hypothetical protein [Planctomycetota bacterium]
MIRRRIASLFLLLVTAGLAALWFYESDHQIRPPQQFGRIWTNAPCAGPVVAFVTREERERSIQVRRGRFQSEQYDRYVLHVHSGTDGAPLQTLALGDARVRQDEQMPQILGIVGDVLWLWRSGPEARSLPGLELLCDTARLTERAPERAKVLPTEPKRYAVSPQPHALVVRGRDARLYTLQPREATITELAFEQLPTTTFSQQLEDRFDHLRPPGRSRVFTHPYNLLETTFLTRTGQWYGLLVDAERQQLGEYAPHGRPHGDVARRLYRATYTLDGNHPKLDVSAAEALGDERLLQAGFLIRNDQSLWDVPEPSSTLVLAKAALGEDEPWQVVRLARDGTVLWRTSTELADPGEILDLGTHVLFVGMRSGLGHPDPEHSDRRERLVWIDQASGARSTLFVATGERQPAPQP